MAHSLSSVPKAQPSHTTWLLSQQKRKCVVTKLWPGSPHESILERVPVSTVIMELKKSHWEVVVGWVYNSSEQFLSALLATLCHQANINTTTNRKFFHKTWNKFIKKQTKNSKAFSPKLKKKSMTHLQRPSKKQDRQSLCLISHESALSTGIICHVTRPARAEHCEAGNKWYFDSIEGWFTTAGMFTQQNTWLGNQEVKMPLAYIVWWVFGTWVRQHFLFHQTHHVMSLWVNAGSCASLWNERGGDGGDSFA